MSGFPPDLRARSLAALRNATVDILIIGGGINGAGVARDLGMRKQQAGVSLEVALVEQNHFASGTSGKNSQLIHGGLRYLKYLKMNLVKESLRERSILRNLAPHLVDPLAFLLPIYSRFEKMKVLMGLTMYDRLAGDFNIAKHREVSRAEIAELEPNLAVKDLVGGALFYDCMVHSARFVLENLFDAAANGVHLANYVRASPAERSPDGIWHVNLEDTLSGDRFDLRAKKIIDATGAWSKPEQNPPRLVRGSHIVLPRLGAEDHAVAYFDDNGRIIFFLPWGSDRQNTLLGTTDVDHDGPAEDPHISKEEMDYLIGIAQKLYPNALSFTPIASFSSLRPLAAAKDGNATEATREHRIFTTPDGILRIQGGKYTTYRAMAEEAVGGLLKEIAPWLAANCRTAVEPLCGNSERVLSRLRLEAAETAEKHLLSKTEIERLIKDYGVHTPELLELLPPEDYGPIRRTEYARIAFAVHREMALRLTDVLFVSTYLGFDRRWDAASLEIYANLIGAWLGWDSTRQAREIKSALSVTQFPGQALS